MLNGRIITVFQWLGEFSLWNWIRTFKWQLLIVFTFTVYARKLNYLSLQLWWITSWTVPSWCMVCKESTVSRTRLIRSHLTSIGESIFMTFKYKSLKRIFLVLKACILRFQTSSLCIIRIQSSFRKKKISTFFVN